MSGLHLRAHGTAHTLIGLLPTDHPAAASVPAAVPVPAAVVSAPAASVAVAEDVPAAVAQADDKYS